MNKTEKLETFVKLNKTEKKNLTLSWLIDLIKTQQLKIEDVIDILNCVEPTFSKLYKLEYFLTSGKISISSLSRLLGFGYAKSSSIINKLSKRNIIVRYEKDYKIIDKINFKRVMQEICGGY